MYVLRIFTHARTLAYVSDGTPNADSRVAGITSVVWECGTTTRSESGIACQVRDRTERL